MTADLGPSPCMYLRVSVWSRLGVGFGVVISGCVYERGKYLGQCLGGGGGWIQETSEFDEPQVGCAMLSRVNRTLKVRAV